MAGASSEDASTRFRLHLWEQHGPGGFDESSESARWVQAASVFGLGLLYVGISSALIAYNKYLITPGRFPFAVPLVFMHTVFCFSLALLLYLVRPALFSSIVDDKGRITLRSGVVFKFALPIALFFSGQLALGNTAYLHSSVAFLQMMKEANLALVYALSLAVMLEDFSLRRAMLLGAVLAATMLTIHGELNFSSTGFALQGASQVCESMRIVLQAVLLSSNGHKLDAFAYILLVMPFSAMFLGATLGTSRIVAGADSAAMANYVPLPSWQDLAVWWPHLIANACLAFSLNLVIAMFMKHSSAVSFILAGILKDALIVMCGVFLHSEVITFIQVVGFGLQLLFVLVYTLVKTFPEDFENGLAAGIVILLTTGGTKKQSPSKGTPVLPPLGAAAAAAKGYGATGAAAAELEAPLAGEAAAGCLASQRGPLPHSWSN